MIQNYIEELNDSELEVAFEEIKQWRKTGILNEGIVRNVYDKAVETQGEFPLFTVEYHFLFEMAKRYYR